MTREEKQLLFKDLSARLPYGVIISWCNEKVEHKRFILESITSKKYKSYIRDGKQLAINGEYIEWKLNNIYTLGEFIKPYLRPMSSMTEEEEKEWSGVIDLELKALEGEGGHTVANAASSAFEIDFYNSHHFDYRGLIEKCLALEAPADMYKIK